MTVVPDVLRAAADRFPDRPAAFVDGAESMTFAQWESGSNQVARGLLDLGLKPGDRVATLIAEDDAIRAYVAYVAAQKFGGVPVPINARLSPREIAHIVRIAQPSVLIASLDQATRARRAIEDLNSPPLVVCPAAGGSASEGKPMQRTWESLLEGEFRGALSPPDETDLADILFTSGTTGLPKGVASTHENLLSIPVLPSDQPDSMLHAAPLGTALGTYGTMLTCLRLALTNVCLPRFSTARFGHLIQQRRPGWLMVVPAHVQLLAESRVLDTIDVSSVAVVLSGTAPLPPDSFAWLASRFPNAVVMNAYSLTEAGDSACLMSYADAARHPGSVGKPIAGGAVRVVDGSGAAIAPGEIGELQLRLRRGRRLYFGDPNATADTFTDGWVQSGDLGCIDGDGFVYVVDRKKDMIIRGGFNVYSIEVENAMREHPAVMEAGMIGIPHRVLGQDVAAVVRLHDDASLDLHTLQAFLADRLADYKIPRTLVFTDDPLPRTVAGKFDRRALMAMVMLDSDRSAPSR